MKLFAPNTIELVPMRSNQVFDKWIQSEIEHFLFSSINFDNEMAVCI